MSEMCDISFKEFLQQANLNEMQYSRDAAIQRIQHLKKPMATHIIKLIYLKDNISNNKHISDIQDGWLKSIQTINVVKGIKLDYHELLFVSESEFKRHYLTGKLKRQYSKIPVQRTEEETYELLCTIMNDVQDMIEQDDINYFQTYIEQHIIK